MLNTSHLRALILKHTGNQDQKQTSNFFSIRNSANVSPRKVRHERQRSQIPPKNSNKLQRYPIEVIEKNQPTMKVNIKQEKRTSYQFPLIENKKIATKLNNYSKQTLMSKNLGRSNLLINDSGLLQSNSKYSSAKMVLDSLPILKRRDVSKISNSTCSTTVARTTPRSLEQALIEDVINSTTQTPLNSNQQKELGLSSINQFYSPFIRENNIPQSVKANTLKNDFLAIHEVKAENRAKMIDWMLQVFRALNVSSHQTFFTGVSILDRYFEIKQSQNISIKLEELHLLGLVSIFMSSKFEDIYPIRMIQVVRDAAHNKFAIKDILNAEADILKTLQFKLQSQSIYEESFILFKNCEMEYKKDRLNNYDKDQINQFLMFICTLAIHLMDLISLPKEQLILSIVNVTLKFVKDQAKKSYRLNKMTTPSKFGAKDTQLSSNYVVLRGLYRHYKVHYYETFSEANSSCKSISKLIINEYNDFQSKNGHLLNLEKTFPQFFSEESLSILAKKFII